MISATSDIDRIELECLIGAARTAAIILGIVTEAAVVDQDHADGQLTNPMSERHEDALTQCVDEVRHAVEKLYNRFHGVETGGAS